MRGIANACFPMGPHFTSPHWFAMRGSWIDLPVGLSLAIVDDDAFVGVQTYERIAWDGSGAVAPEDGVPLNQMGSAVEPLSPAGSVRHAHVYAAVVRQGAVSG